MNLDKPFREYGESAQLAGKFLLVFSRFEFALLKAGFIDRSRDKPAVDKDKFFNVVRQKLSIELAKNEFYQRVKPLIEHPPLIRKQQNGQITWKSSQQRGDVAECVFYATWDVRNNLFHGAKIPLDPARDVYLLKAALALIEFCIASHDCVQEWYFNH